MNAEKKFKLRDLKVGDWVYVWDNHTQTLSPPVVIVAIDGKSDHAIAVCSFASDARRWVKLDNVRGIPVTIDILRKFGFTIDPMGIGGYTEIYYLEDEPLFYMDEQECFLDTGFDDDIEVCFVHEIQNIFDAAGVDLTLKWDPDK